MLPRKEVRQLCLSFYQELKDEKARELAYLLSLLAETAIPWSLVPALMPEANEAEMENWRDNELLDLGLLQRVDEGSFIMDPEVQELVGVKMLLEFKVADRIKSVCRAIAAIGKAISDKLTREEVVAIAPVIPHVAKAASLYGEDFEKEDIVWPFVGLGNFYYSQKLYDLAEIWFEEGLVEAENLAPDLELAVLLHHLGMVYSHQQRYEEAREKFLEALEMRKQLLDPAHPDVAVLEKSLEAIAAI